MYRCCDDQCRRTQSHVRRRSTSSRRGRIGSPPRLHCLRIEGDDGARQRGAGGDREAAARCNVFTKPYLRNAAVRTRGPYGVDEWLARADETIE